MSVADEDKKAADTQAPEQPDAAEPAKAPKPPEAPDKADAPEPPDAAEPAKAAKPPEAPEKADAPEQPDAAEPAKAAKPPEAPEKADAPGQRDAAEPAKAPKQPDAAEPAKAAKPPEAPDKAKAPKPPDAAEPAKAAKPPEAPEKADAPGQPDAAEPAKAPKPPEASDAMAGADEATGGEAQPDEGAGNGETRTLTDLADLGGVTAGAPPPEPETPEPKIDAQGRSYATGKRKDAIARVWIKPGSGRITVNGRDWETYFARPVLRMIIDQPWSRPRARTSTISGARSRAAGFPARRAPCATGSPRR